MPGINEKQQINMSTGTIDAFNEMLSTKLLETLNHMQQYHLKQTEYEISSGKQAAMKTIR